MLGHLQYVSDPGPRTKVSRICVTLGQETGSVSLQADEVNVCSYVAVCSLQYHVKTANVSVKGLCFHEQTICVPDLQVHSQDTCSTLMSNDFKIVCFFYFYFE